MVTVVTELAVFVWALNCKSQTSANGPNKSFKAEEQGMKYEHKKYILKDAHEEKKVFKSCGVKIIIFGTIWFYNTKWCLSN